jgi:hypothetical protein
MNFYKTVVYASHPPYTTEPSKYDGPIVTAEDWEEAKTLCRLLYPYAQITGETDERLSWLWNNKEEHEDTITTDEHQQDSEEIH